MVIFFALPVRAQNDDSESVPKILMLDVKGLTPYNRDLYRAVLAQLSGAPLILDRAEISVAQPFLADPLGNSSTLAAKKHAAMVFWIEDKATCRLFFYIPDKFGGRIRSRTLDLQPDSSWNRFQIIAIAAASMVEGLLVTHRISPVGPISAPSVEPAPQPEKENVSENSRKWLELSVSYSGTLLGQNMVTHGASIGLGVRPNKNFVVAASFHPSAPVSYNKSEEYRLSISSRRAEASVAGRIPAHFLDLRLGIAWSVDFRSFSFVSQTDNIDAAPDGSKAIHSLVPFLSAVWRLTERVGIVNLVGVGFALNDTTYQLDRVDAVTAEFSPYSVRLYYQLGLLVQL